MVRDNVMQITPFLHVRDFDAMVAFFVDTLGFSAPVNDGGYAYVERGNCGVRIMRSDAAHTHGEFEVYADVADVDALARELAPRLAELPAADVLGPIDQRWGKRELIVRAPNGNLVAFGQDIAR